KVRSRIEALDAAIDFVGLLAVLADRRDDHLMHIVRQAPRRSARREQAHLGVGLGGGKARPVMQTVAVECDDGGAFPRLHPDESTCLVLEAPARLDDLERAGVLGPDGPQNQRGIGSGQATDQRRESYDAFERPGVVITLGAALLALAAPGLELPREIG